MEHIWDSDFISEKLKCALLDILHEIPSDSDLLDPSAAPSVVASLFKKQSTALLTTFRSKEVAEADPAVTIKVILLLYMFQSTSVTINRFMIIFVSPKNCDYVYRPGDKQ